MSDDIPRRARLDKCSPAELAIYEAMQAVERAGCDVRLTEAVILLQKARDRVADFVDGSEGFPASGDLVDTSQIEALRELATELLGSATQAEADVHWVLSCFESRLRGRGVQL